jgi:hypothetical protein
MIPLTYLAARWSAGPCRSRLRRVAATAWALIGVAGPVQAGQDWFPPRPVSLVVPSVTLAPGQPRAIDLLVRANGAPANLRWTATPAGDFLAILSATQGTVSLAADQIAAIPITVTVPAGVTGLASGFITVRLFYEPGGGTAAPLQVAMIRAATLGRPQMYPLPSTSIPVAGGPASVTYELRSTIATDEVFHLTATPPQNPDENNAGLAFPYWNPTTPRTLPALGTIQVSVPIHPPGVAYPGNLNSFRLEATSDSDDEKFADAKGHAFLSAADPDSVPATFHPVGVVPQEQVAAGRDGPARIPGRDLWLVPSGWLGLRVLHDSALSQVGKLDRDANGLDDRLVGNIRIPAYAAAVTLVPGFVNGAQEVLDLGLLAAGKAGLMLLDLRDIFEPRIGSWEDFYDLDANGIDDRILRMIPIAGFATDVEWFRTPEGRVVALVAAADTGSTPVGVQYNAALTTPGSGAGVVAVDVLAALDSLPGVPFMAGEHATPGTALDLEIRGGSQPDLAVADGAGGLALFGLTATGSPAVVSFAAQASVTLDGAWGNPYARDIAWVANSDDSLYLAVAAASGGVQLLRTTPGGGPAFLALTQQIDGVAIALATTRTGLVAAAMGAAGATMLRLPSRGELDQIAPGAPDPYQAPVVLGLGASWTEGRPLSAGYHGTLSSSITALRFKPPADGTIPDLLCADGSRTLVLRPGAAALVGVAETGTSGPKPLVQLSVTPNPFRDRVLLQVQGDPIPVGDMKAAEFAILDLQGRLVRRLPATPRPGQVGVHAAAFWDGRDLAGVRATPGRFWVVASLDGVRFARSSFVLLH